jgi:secernin
MDLVRLGLERSKTSYEAVGVITNLLENYGSGFCENPNSAKYHNNYMVADPDEAWVLETAGRYWVAKRILDGVYHEGNMYSIQTDWDECHQGLINHAIEMNWCESKEDFNFARCYSDFIEWPPFNAMVRNRRGEKLLREIEGKITPKTLMEILRDHLEGSMLESLWTPGENFYYSIYCHEKPWGGGQTAASMVVKLDRNLPDLLKATCWASMTAPCTSVFMPFYPKTIKVPEQLSIADESYSDNSPWWIFKRLQRHTEKNYHLLGEFTKTFWSDVEKKMMEQHAKVERYALQLIRDGNIVEVLEHLQEYVNHLSDECVEQARRLNQTLHDIEDITPCYTDLRKTYLSLLNKQVGIKI